MNSQNNKVERYLGRAMGSIPKKGPELIQLPWVLLPFVACGLGAWTIYSGGPENALKGAYALTWVFICLNVLMLALMALASMWHAIISEKDPLAGDRMLFVNDYRSSWLNTIVSLIDTPMFIALSIVSGWTFTTFCLVMLFIAGLIGKYVHKLNKINRRKELADMDEARLHSFFANAEEEEKVGDDIRKLFPD